MDDCASSLGESAEQLSTSAEANRDVRTALLNRIDEFMSFSFFPGELTRIDYGSESEDEATEERLLYAILGFSSLLTAASLEKITPACQNNSLHDRIADSSSTDPLCFSSACTTKR